MKRVAFLSVLVISSIAFAIQSVTPSDVVKSPEQFDKKTVKVRGIVKKFKAKTSKAGNPYLLFDLTSGSDKISVYSHGKLEKDLVDGDKVEVEGIFNKVKTVGTFSFKNEIDCSAKKKGGKPNISTIK